MAKLQRVEGQIDLKCDADKLLDVWACKSHLAPTIIYPNKVNKIELLEGDWNKVGAVYNWSYVLNDQTLTVKTKIEELDAENRRMSYSYPGVEGIGSKIQVTPKGLGSGCTVNWCIEYEKVNEDVPPPNAWLDFLLDCAKAIDAYLCRA